MNQHEKEIPGRLNEGIDGEDDMLIWDLSLNNSKKPEQYIEFLTVCQKYIANADETAVDDRRHDKVTDDDVVTHLALALNAKNLYNEVVKIMSTPIMHRHYGNTKRNLPLSFARILRLFVKMTNIQLR